MLSTLRKFQDSISASKKPKRRNTASAKKLAEAISLLGEKDKEIDRLSREKMALQLRAERAEASVEKHQEKILALCMPTENYSRFLAERNTTTAEREIKELIDNQKLQDYDGLGELGILTADMPVVDIKPGEEKVS